MRITNKQESRGNYSLFTILFSLIMLSALSHADFSRDDATGIVTDNSTTLQWQDDVNISKTWENAIDYCENTVSLGGHTDWRLPNFNELYYLADRSKINPAIDNTFQSVVSRSYWSSTTVAGLSSNAWDVYFGDGSDGWRNKSASRYVRCVRDGQ